jgi:hypothetical protein
MATLRFYLYATSVTYSIDDEIGKILLAPSNTSIELLEELLCALRDTWKEKFLRIHVEWYDIAKGPAYVSKIEDILGNKVAVR